MGAVLKTFYPDLLTVNTGFVSGVGPLKMEAIAANKATKFTGYPPSPKIRKQVPENGTYSPSASTCAILHRSDLKPSREISPEICHFIPTNSLHWK
jgi:hypothetical protein